MTTSKKPNSNTLGGIQSPTTTTTTTTTDCWPSGTCQVVTIFKQKSCCPGLHLDTCSYYSDNSDNEYFGCY